MCNLSYRRRHRFAAEVIQYAVWLYFRFPLSFRDVEDLLAQRGIEVSYETVRRWSVNLALPTPESSVNRIHRRHALALRGCKCTECKALFPKSEGKSF
jgi:transposase-like protein